jgi:hypothetical protein
MRSLDHAIRVLGPEEPHSEMSMVLFVVPFLGAAVRAAVTHYPPVSSNINNFTFALNGSGAPGIFSSSTTPNAQYGEYNWCNMPHVRDREYK